ncbi:ferredoxin [Mycobacterium syngnathidarum]
MRGQNLPMKVQVDRQRCKMHGECVFAVPEVFDLEDGHDTVTVVNPEPGEELRKEIELAVLVCPEGAISVAY